MPFSHSGQISTIIQEIERLNPDSMLDVGTGMGQYGFLARTNLENINLFVIDGKTGRQAPREQWRVRIDGIEGFAGYLTPVHEYAYNRVIIGNALDVLPTLEDNSYDLVMAIDILEHFERNEGFTFLGELKRVARKNVLVSTPKMFIEQEIEANPLENHRSIWTSDDLLQAGYARMLPDATSWIALCDL